MGHDMRVPRAGLRRTQAGLAACALALLTLTWAPSRASGAHTLRSSPSPARSGNYFADLAALSYAVDACIAAVPSGIGCYAANNDICGAGVNCGEIGTWDVSAVTSMLELFKHKAAFNADISEWNTAAVTNMGGMFAGGLFATTAFDQDISSWDVSV